MNEMCKFQIGDHVRKKSGSEWEGFVCGTYSTALTPEGYAVESATHKGSVQIYPASALDLIEEEEHPRFESELKEWEPFGLVCEQRAVAAERILNAYKANATGLDISGLNLTSLPNCIGQLSNLQVLALGNNQLKELPPEIGNLSNLRALHISSNRLQDLPQEIGNLSNLRWLDLNNNQMKELPVKVIQKLTKLETLYI